MTEILETDNYTVCFVNSTQKPEYTPLEIFKYSNDGDIRFYQMFEERYKRYIDGVHVCDDILLNWYEISISNRYHKAFIAACDLQSGLSGFKT